MTFKLVRKFKKAMSKVIAYFDMDPSQTKRARNYNIYNVIQWLMQQKLC